MLNILRPPFFYFLFIYYLATNITIKPKLLDESKKCMEGFEFAPAHSYTSCIDEHFLIFLYPAKSIFWDINHGLTNRAILMSKKKSLVSYQNCPHVDGLV